MIRNTQLLPAQCSGTELETTCDGASPEYMKIGSGYGFAWSREDGQRQRVRQPRHPRGEATEPLALSKLCSLLNHSTSLLSHFFFICFMFTLALNRLALLQAQNQVAFLFFFSYLASDRANRVLKENTMRFILAPSIQKNPTKTKTHGRPPSHTAKFYSVGASTLLPISGEAEGFYFFQQTVF